MKGTERCDEIVRLIDETLAEASPSAGEVSAASRARSRAAHPAFGKPKDASTDREKLLAAVDAFLADTVREGLVASR